MINIAFVVRNDFYEKFGGDTHQINQYISCNDNGDIFLSTITLDQFINLNKYDKIDYYILTNIDRASDFVQMGMVCTKNKLFNKTLILPIHHSSDAMNKFNKLRFQMIWPFIDVIGGTLFIEKIKGIYRNISTKKYSIAFNSLFVNYKKHISSTLNNSLGLICIANGEYENIRKDFEMEKKEFFIVRNGVSLTPDKCQIKSIEDRLYDVIVCGRVEERKNQIAILDALQGSNLRILFLGGVNKFNKQYAKNFFDRIERNPQVTHIDQVNPEDVLGFYGNSKVSLSASWFEVSSLADIEAASCGCFVFSSINGHSAEIISKNQIKLIDPEKLNSLDSMIRDAIDYWKTTPVTQLEFHTWKDSNRELISGLKGFIIR
ncbi:TPA: glycosyltransferase [Raoultella ornithinolytica]|uniref:glycosyltransferase n=1 Tax=Raoultella ornithinolytica TaxID=54291 RepID=UPI0004DB0B71|nr:glycosyltransferase [Raoultella ornithinolytica]KDV93010.1 glycosyl transferases group 1 family protein [Raoultella ornithinolytica 2-156-04_S1_C1]KDX13253.1 glycosyl transferases group 1 family protein [Raoultella ornithinolytica 2-156-04_S1_C2]